MGVSDTTEEDWENHYRELYCHTISCPYDDCTYVGECLDRIKEQLEKNDVPDINVGNKKRRFL